MSVKQQTTTDRTDEPTSNNRRPGIPPGDPRLECTCGLQRLLLMVSPDATWDEIVAEAERYGLLDDAGADYRQQRGDR